MDAMTRVHPWLLLIAVLGSASCSCPREKIHSFGSCAFTIHCIEYITGIMLPSHCTTTCNNPVLVEVTLVEATQKFDDIYAVTGKNSDFLHLVTSLRVSGNLPMTGLTILRHMPRLQKLYLEDDNIEHIFGRPLFFLDYLETIHLDGNKLRDIRDLFRFNSIPNNTRELSLAHNLIEAITEDTFSELASLVELDLSYNAISQLNRDSFKNLTNLETLKLNNNNLTDLNGAIDDLNKLKHLFLNGNRIQSIDVASLRIIHALETFDISDNNLGLLMPGVFSRQLNNTISNSVCKMILSGNQITSLSDTNSTNEILERPIRSSLSTILNTADVLTELDLSKNKIWTIHYNAFQPINRLAVLDLSQNELQGFSVDPMDLLYVQYLNLSSNHIKNICYTHFLSMSHLRNLDLSHNMFSKIPEEIFTHSFGNIRYLNMTHNQIKTQSLGKNIYHPQGGVLDLSNTGLLKLNLPSGEVLHVHTVYLDFNNITEPCQIDLVYLNELQNVYMRHNLIEELSASSLRFPLTLSHLDLSFNRIAKIRPLSFLYVSHLYTLHLAHNELSEIDYGAFQGLASLTYLDLSFNKIHHLDSKVLMDLKSLTALSLRFNGMYVLDSRGWLGHKFDLKVFLEGNYFTCDWLGTALSDFNNGYTKMRPTVWSSHVTKIGEYTLDGIPCVKKVSEPLEEFPSIPSNTAVMADERLLLITQQILEAVREQNSFLKQFVRGSQEQLQRMIKG